MPLHPQARQLREARERQGVVPLYRMTLARARAEDLAAIQAASGDRVPVDRVENLTYPGPAGPLPVRVYRPAAGEPLPVLLYFFGGGWTLGSIDTADDICRRLANAVPAVVVVPGYRLAPEAKFPAAVRDCQAALTWVLANADHLGADPDRVALGGDSAGGNLAAAVALANRGGVPLAGQLLVYPNTDFRADTASLRENVDELMFNRTSVAWYWSMYLADPADGDDPLASPLRAPDLSGLPPALIITAEYDPLRDEGEQYGHRLAQAGVPVEVARYDGMVHGFFAMSGTFDAAEVAMAQAAKALRDWFSVRH